eukprot:scaffold37464_cov31-Tisochrysis_lutea.AAC.6
MRLVVLLLAAPVLAASLSLVPRAPPRAASPRLDAAQQQIISFSDAALRQIAFLKEKQGAESIHLRMGVRAGGCSGMSYIMDFMKQEEVDEKDTVIEYEGGIRCVIDPKSLMFLYGLRLDYSDVRARMRLGTSCCCVSQYCVRSNAWQVLHVNI